MHLVGLYFNFQGASCGEATGLSPSCVSGSSKIEIHMNFRYFFMIFFFCCCSSKGKNCNTSSKGCTFETGRGGSVPLPQWMGLLQHLLFGCMSNEDVKSQRSGKNSPGRQGVLLLGWRLSQVLNPVFSALLGGCWSQPHWKSTDFSLL